MLLRICVATETVEEIPVFLNQQLTKPLPWKLSATTRSCPQHLDTFNMQSTKTRGFKNTGKHTHITSLSDFLGSFWHVAIWPCSFWRQGQGGILGQLE